MPEVGLYFKLGKPVIITFDDGTEKVFASLPFAQTKLGLKRGVIQGCITRKSTSHLIDDGQKRPFTAKICMN